MNVVPMIARRRKFAVEVDVLVQIRVAPLPLVSGHLDRQIRSGGVLHLNHGSSRGVSHAGDDQAGDDGPRDFERRAA
jgi:hypothetical protein